MAEIKFKWTESTCDVRQEVIAEVYDCCVCGATPQFSRSGKRFFLRCEKACIPASGTSAYLTTVAWNQIHGAAKPPKLDPAPVRAPKAKILTKGYIFPVPVVDNGNNTYSVVSLSPEEIEFDSVKAKLYTACFEHMIPHISEGLDLPGMRWGLLRVERDYREGKYVEVRFVTGSDVPLSDAFTIPADEACRFAMATMYSFFGKGELSND